MYRYIVSSHKWSKIHPSLLTSNSQINCFIIVLWIKACAKLYTSFFYPGDLFVPQSKWCNIFWKTTDLKLRRYPWDAKMNLESHIQYHIRYFLTNIRPAHIKHRYIVPPVFPSLEQSSNVSVSESSAQWHSEERSRASNAIWVKIREITPSQSAPSAP